MKSKNQIHYERYYINETHRTEVVYTTKEIRGTKV
jgi:hypothetical protein